MGFIDPGPTPGLDQIGRRATGCADTSEAWERLAAWWTVQVRAQAACKHGTHDCQRCGTSDRRDALHATKAGQGRIARLRREGGR